jgi:hypothetical protein
MHHRARTGLLQHADSHAPMQHAAALAQRVLNAA